MAAKFNLTRIRALQTDARENIESYLDPETPKALEQYTAKMKAVLLRDPELLASLPEYLPVALYGRVKFVPAAKAKWQHWLSSGIAPGWDDFKTSAAFNNADIELVKAIRAYSEPLLIESCAVLFLMEYGDVSNMPGDNEPAADTDEQPQDDDSGYDNDNYRSDEYSSDDFDDPDEPGYDNQYDEIRFNREKPE